MLTSGTITRKTDFIYNHHPEGVVYRTFCFLSSTFVVSETASRRWWRVESPFSFTTIKAVPHPPLRDAPALPHPTSAAEDKAARERLQATWSAECDRTGKIGEENASLRVEVRPAQRRWRATETSRCRGIRGARECPVEGSKLLESGSVLPD